MILDQCGKMRMQKKHKRVIKRNERDEIETKNVNYYTACFAFDTCRDDIPNGCFFFHSMQDATLQYYIYYKNCMR